MVRIAGTFPKIHVSVHRGRLMLPLVEDSELSMAKLQAVGTALVASSIMACAAFAQGGAPITTREVVGEWLLTITPAQRQDLGISIESADGGPADFPLSIAAQPNGRLSCVVSARPAECRIDAGKLVVSARSKSGSARMTFTLADRAPRGLSGTASVRIRLLPVGGHLGSVTMTRR
jgi:hypothetical protein